MSRLTCRAVVANSERNGAIRIDVLQSVADLGVAANLLGALPHDLREVAPLLKVGHVRVRLAVQVVEVVELIVVHQVGDHHADILRGNTVTDVLTVATTTDLTIAKLVQFSLLTSSSQATHVLCSYTQPSASC